MKNTTLSRKPSHDMKPGQGAYGINPRAKTTSQAGDGADFAFNGQMGDGVNRMNEGTRCHNPFTLGDRSDRINKGLGPRTGNQSDSVRTRTHGTSATGDAHKKTIATASQGGKINGGATAKSPATPDSIYYK